METFIGTSGWSYSDWRGKFYPAGLAAAEFLPYLAQHFPTVEINSSFYRLQSPTTYRKWAASTPDGFRFAVKGPRSLRAGGDPAPFFDSLALGNKQGPILWQLAASQKFDAQKLDAFFKSLPAGFQYALEPRTAGYDTPEALDLLRKHEVALVMADSGGRYPQYDQVTANTIYIRLHGSPRMYYSNYQPEVLAQWATRIRQWRAAGHEPYVYFDNTAAGYAPANAAALREDLANE